MRRYVWGRLDQFLECFSVFFCISSAFLPWNHLPEFFCVSRGLFSVFSWKNWRHFAVALCCCRFKCVGPFVHGFFKIFSMPTTHPTLNNQLADLLAPFMTAPPFSGDSMAFLAVASGVGFPLKRDGSRCGPRASSVRPDFCHCVSCR